MDKANAAKIIESFVRQRFQVDQDDPDFDHDLHLFDYGYVDSFGAVELTQFVEVTFAVKIGDADFFLYPLNTINEIAHFVVQRQQGVI